MDVVERGDGLTVPRDGQSIGELVPLRRQRRFVSRAEFAAGSRTPIVDPDALRSDLDEAFDGDLHDPHAR